MTTTQYNSDSPTVFQAWKNVPADYNTASKWQWKYDRTVNKGERPTAIVYYDVQRKARRLSEQDDGSLVEDVWETYTEQVSAKLYHRDQTRELNRTPYTRSVRQFAELFLDDSSTDFYIWCSSDWTSCLGKLPVERLKSHLAQGEDYGVRGGKWTRFVAIDHDLHNGDLSIFRTQTQILLDRFYCRDNWHLELKDQQAGGVHYIRTFAKRRDIEAARCELRRQLVELDDQHPDLAARARAAGMHSFATMEIYPDQSKGFRLPFANGRSLYLDRPLPLINRRERLVADVESYMAWLAAPRFSSVSDVLTYIEQRLKQHSEAPQQPHTERPKSRAAGDVKAGSTGVLGRLRGRYWQVLTEFWSGANCPPDSLNEAIIITARIAPFYFSDQWEAVERIEQMIDELPDVGFSDRLSSENRGKVSEIVRQSVETAYSNRGERQPEKLANTAAKWQAAGLDPFSRDTQHTTASILLPPSGSIIDWTPDEREQLESFADILKTDTDTTSTIINHLVQLIHQHDSGLALSKIKSIIESYGVPASSKRHNKPTRLVDRLRELGWLVMYRERQFFGKGRKGRKGRARSYMIGPALRHHFEEQQPERPHVEVSDDIDLAELQAEFVRLSA